MPHYTNTTYFALLKLQFYNKLFHLIITKTIVKIHYNINNNILTSKLTINNINIHSLRSIFYSKVSLQICKVYGYTYIHIYTYMNTHTHSPPMDP